MYRIIIHEYIHKYMYTYTLTFAAMFFLFSQLWQHLGLIQMKKGTPLNIITVKLITSFLLNQYFVMYHNYSIYRAPSSKRAPRINAPLLSKNS